MVFLLQSLRRHPEINRWLAVTVGSGVVSLLMISNTFDVQVLHYLGTVFFLLDMLPLALAFVASFLRYDMIRHTS
ncbi:hypothetical protein PDIG_22300 [Penicillium digitatum PHI26]|uniref:Uncharacterized protein n=2 Tax=Penicillium digitatum TaxID=36651 RepID=K9G406_PEND2|nr:hypothetical protein PDIP_24580 [Penicillium digitatum Pd1]EKV16104.1 hypothetical protein PDIG_22300 [Penicillium digitatum PHI26]EKV19299.1 hypothetical protein PDIP_24580 [Penicillium digitatum Pd1]